MKRDDEQCQPFAIVPIEVMMDKRLTLETMRVLVTLFSFRNKVTGLAFPKREALAKRCGMHPSNISAATTKLVELGWLIKAGSGGFGLATKYTITVPEIVAQSATVVQSATVAEQATTTVAAPAIRTVAQSATRIKATYQLTNKGTEKTASDESDARFPALENETELQAACKATWQSYSDSYFNRYGVEPLRNAAVNSVIKSFCQKIPHHEAPHVAAFYVLHNDKFYVQKTHPVSLMGKDAEGLRTQWATGRTMTASKATQLDRTASNLDSVNQAIEMMKARKQNASV